MYFLFNNEVEVCYDPALVSSKEEHIRTVCGSFIPTTSDVELPSIKVNYF